MVSVKRTASFSSLGQRANNEDSFGIKDEVLFVVCDGVGGNERGEIASRLVVDTFLEQESTQGTVPIQTLRRAEARLSEYVQEHLESKGMATTLAFLRLSDASVQVAWCGDSRVYQFRDGQVIRCTKDHSWVNQALDAGIITEEEAIGHPKSNIITRAIQGEHNPQDLEVEYWSDIRNGDVFFLCSDGVLETWSNEGLAQVFQVSSVDDALKTIEDTCSRQSRDNSTAIAIEVRCLEARGVGALESTKSPDVVSPRPLGHYRKRSRIGVLGVLIALLVILAMAVVFFWKKEWLNQQFLNKKPPTSVS